MTGDPDVLQRITTLREQVGGRASGLWRRENDRLVLVAFSAAPDMAPEVAHGFAEATQSVPVDRVELGIVRALVEGEPAVSVAAELPPELGSGRWLRAFGAALSIAVPLADDSGTVVAVLAVSIRDEPPNRDQATAAIRSCGAALVGTTPPVC